MSVQDYPWSSTKPGECKRFEFVTNHGFRTFLARRKVRKGIGEVLNDVLSSSLVDLLEGLLDCNPDDRVCLGERCWNQEVAATSRRSVLDMQWMSDSRAAFQPLQSDLEADPEYVPEHVFEHAPEQTLEPLSNATFEKVHESRSQQWSRFQQIPEQVRGQVLEQVQ